MKKAEEFKRIEEESAARTAKDQADLNALKENLKNAEADDDEELYAAQLDSAVNTGDDLKEDTELKR